MVYYMNKINYITWPDYVINNNSIKRNTNTIYLNHDYTFPLPNLSTVESKRLWLLGTNLVFKYDFTKSAGSSPRPELPKQYLTTI